MSINAKQQIKCPDCGQLEEMTVWQSITANDSPDLKDDLLKGKINIFRCPSCGQTALVPVPVLYTDRERNLIISFSPCSEAEEKQRIFEGIRTASKESGELAEFEGCNLRFVSAYNDFLEKILIFDNGLHDKAVEVLKLFVLMQDSEKMERRVCIFGKKENDSIEFMVQDKEEGRLYTSCVPMETYNTIYEQLSKSGVKYKSFDWEIIDGEYAAKLLRGANNTL